MNTADYIKTDDSTYFRVLRQAYVCPEIWKKEIENIFEQSWLYIGHESEVKELGSFQSRHVGGRPLILVRSEDGVIRTFLNACAHRGAAVCREQEGKTRRFTCPYHGWAYDTAGNIVGLPGHTAYGPHDSLPPVNLKQITNQSYRGFIFIYFGLPQHSLREYLGEATAYIDLVCDQSEAPLQVIPRPFEHGLHANWKLLAENGVDAYHLPFAHSRFLKYIDTRGATPISHKRTGIGLPLGNGHAVIKSGPPSTGRPIAFWSPLFPEEMKAVIVRRYSELVERIGEKKAQDMALTNRSLFIFPNLVINDILGLNIRTFFPTAPNRAQVSVWAAGFENETTSEHQARIDALISFVGPGGLGTPDDVEILESCQRAYAHLATEHSDFSRGMAPETLHHTDEAQNRGFWREWHRRLNGGQTQ